MTTATTRIGHAGGYDARRASARVLLGAGSALVAAGLVVVVVGALVAGSSAVVGALLGTAVTAAVLVTGAMAVDVVAGLRPRASLLVALLTYTLQLLLLGVLLVVVSSSGLADQLAPEWFAGAVIAAALVWTVGQVVLATRVRIPAFDEPSTPRSADPSTSAEGSDR